MVMAPQVLALQLAAQSGGLLWKQTDLVGTTILCTLGLMEVLLTPWVERLGLRAGKVVPTVAEHQWRPMMGVQLEASITMQTQAS